MNRHLFIWLVICSSLLLYAQGENETDLFNQGIKAYQQERYQTAQGIFLNLWQQYPRGKYVTAARLMLAKTYYKLHEYSKVEQLCLSFYSRFPKSNYLDDMHHLLGNTMFKMRNYKRAVEEWLWVIENSKDPRLKRIDGEYILHTMEHFLTPGQVKSLQSNHPNAEFNGLATIVLAKKLLRKGEKAPARALLSKFLQEQPNHFYADEARRLLGKQTAAVAHNGFLFLKASQGERKNIADAIELGMRYALFEHRQRNPFEKIGFRAVEITSSVLNVLRTTLEEIDLNDPLCIMGPIDSDQSAALAMLSRYEKRPYIIPLSSQAGLTGLSPYAFQINPDVYTKGRFLGEYASRKKQIKRIAVLAPANEYGHDFVESFTEAAQSNGSEVVSVQWYYEDAQDFTPQFRAIWREGVYYAFLDSITAVDSTLSGEDLKNAYQEYLDMKFKTDRPGIRIDSTDLPATGIDAIMMVIQSSELIPYVAPQPAFNNIQAQLLGNEGWNDPAQLRKYRDELNGLIYITAGYFDRNSNSYHLFMNRFRSEMKTTPETFHLLGYDIMKWLLSRYEPGISRDEFRQRLEQTNDFNGIMEDIRFSTTPRVNNNLTVIQLNLGQLIPLE